MSWTNRDQIQTEAETLRNFVKEADNAGLAVPGDLQATLEEFDKPFQEDWYPAALEAGEVQWPATTAWSSVALAQHYGVSTRFLDWTRSALVASYFAATESFQQPDDVTSFAIWAYSTASDAARQGLIFQNREPKRTVVVITAPYATNPNLRAQDGVHVARAATRVGWSKPAESYDFVHYFEKVGAFGRQLGQDAFIQFIAPRTSAAAVLWYLAKEEITAARLFPGYGGAARSVLESKLRRRPL